MTDENQDTLTLSDAEQEHFDEAAMDADIQAQIVEDFDADVEASDAAKVAAFIAEQDDKVVPIGDNSANVDVQQENACSAFELALKVFKTAQEVHMAEALICSRASLVHYYDFGDTSLMTKFLEAMDDDFSHRAKYVKWLRAHADVAIDGEKKIYKDRTVGAIETSDGLLATALTKPFWKFSNSPPIESWNSNDLFIELDKLTKRMTKRVAPDDKAANKLLAETIKSVAALRVAA